MRYYYICENSKERIERDEPMAEHTNTTECECGAIAKQAIDTYCKSERTKRIFFDD